MKVSPTQVHKYRNCPRLISYEYVLGLRTPPSVKQQFGTDVHAQLENWLSKAEVPDTSPAGETAKQGIKPGYLPTPSEDLLVEFKFEYLWHGLTNVGGFIDCAVTPEFTEDNLPIVIDHKTTSNLRWAMTEDKLAKDSQGLIYAIYAMIHWDIRKTRVRWIYYSASNPKSGHRKPNGCQKTECLFDNTTNEFRKNLSDLCFDIDEIVNIRDKEIPPQDIKPNPTGCQAYGGCPHLARCDLQSSELAAGYFSRIK